MSFGRRNGLPKRQKDTRFSNEEEYAIGMSQNPNRVDESLILDEDEES